MRPGSKMTEEAKRKISAGMTGNRNRCGVTVGNESRAKMSAAHSGKPLSEEHRRRISEGLAKRKTRLTREAHKFN